MLMSAHAIPPAAIDAALERAVSRLAPLWPLQDFVAVNPFLGFTAQGLADTAEHMARSAGARVLMPLSYYAEAIRFGRIGMEDLAKARAEAGALSPLPEAPEALAELALSAKAEPSVPLTPTVAMLASELTGADWEQIAVERLSAWAAGHVDQGQAAWPSPWRHLPPFAAWKAEAQQDRTARIWGLKGFRRLAKALPDSAEAAIHGLLQRLGVQEEGLDAYLDRLFGSIGGWAAYARQRRWQRDLLGGSDESLPALLAARLAWEVALLENLNTPTLREKWVAAVAGLARPVADEASTQTLALQTLLQTAYERAWQRQLAGHFQATGVNPAAEAVRPAMQAVFCIDVRSEVFRRALEAQSPSIETLGFAGFFGFPIAVKAHGEAEATAQCPVLLAPQFEVGHDCRAHGCHDHAHEPKGAKPLQALRRSAVSSFAFVETLGLTYAGKLFADGFAALTGKAKTQEPAPDAPLDLSAIPVEKQVDMAEGALRGMSLTENFARLVVLAGHGASTRNNPHARGLDCGACGGHSGAPNARLAAEILNHPSVREALAARGIDVPDDTLFVPALHDTTTDALHLLDSDMLPASHARDIAQLRASAAAAGRQCRAERAKRLGLSDGAEIDPAVLARASDWSQVRPEWGLAGCAGFVAAPRRRTAGLSLDGRCFLHSYDWRQDEGFGVLELIMTAPVIVASWISLQYYGSVVDNRAFGSGNKVLHNVTAGMGVLEGNGGDLRTGLPWQSVHDGKQFVHEPMRLSVVVEAPLEALSGVIAKHSGLQDLLDHGWISLLVLDDAGCVSHRYTPGGAWEPCAAAAGDAGDAGAGAAPLSQAA